MKGWSGLAASRRLSEVRPYFSGERRGHQAANIELHPYWMSREYAPRPHILVINRLVQRDEQLRFRVPARKARRGKSPRRYGIISFWNESQICLACGWKFLFVT